MRLNGVIFDLDGTLADTLPICIAAFQETFSHFLGKEYSAAEVEALFGATEGGIIERVVRDRTEQAQEYWIQSYTRLHDQCPSLFPGLIETLAELKQAGIAMAIVTGKGPRSAEISLKRLGLEAFIDQVETGSPEAPNKPEAIARVLARWGLPPDTVAYVGDTPYDMKASRSAGLIPLGAAWTPTTTVTQANPRLAEEIFTSVEAFRVWLRNHIAQPQQ